MRLICCDLCGGIEEKPPQGALPDKWKSYTRKTTLDFCPECAKRLKGVLKDA